MIVVKFLSLIILLLCLAAACLARLFKSRLPFKSLAIALGVAVGLIIMSYLALRGLLATVAVDDDWGGLGVTLFVMGWTSIFLAVAPMATLISHTIITNDRNKGQKYSRGKQVALFGMVCVSVYLIMMAILTLAKFKF